MEEHKKRGRPGNTYHVNDVRWMQGGRGGVVPDYKYGRNVPESDFLSTRDLVNVWGLAWQ